MALQQPKTVGATIAFPDGSSLQFDAVINSNPVNDATISKHPTESGRPLTSHMQILPEVINVTGMFTDTPVRRGIAAQDDRAVQLYLRLKQAHETRELVAFISTQTTLVDALVRRIEKPRLPSTGLSVQVSIVLEEVRFPEPVGVGVIPDRILNPVRRSRTIDKGKQTGSRNEDLPEKGSIAKQGVDAAFRNGIAGKLIRAFGS